MENICSPELSFHGTFTPGNESSVKHLLPENIRSMELSLLGAKVVTAKVSFSTTGIKA